jgi:signal transduction histidine kinase
MSESQHMTPSVPAPHDATETWLPWLTTRWPAVIGLIVTLPLTLIAVIGVLDYWPGRTFPGFFLLGNRIVPMVGLYTWTGIERALPFPSRVVALDGSPVTSSRAVYDRVAAAPPGTTFTYALEKGGTRREVAVPSMCFTTGDLCLTIGVLLLFGVASSGLGLTIGFVQPWTRQAQAYLVQGVLSGLFAITAIALYQPGLWWMIHPHLVAQATFPAALINLGLVFPVERRSIERWPALLGLPYLVSAVLLLWVIPTFHSDPPNMTALYAMYLYSGFSVLALAGLLVLSFFEGRSPLVRHRLYAVLPGLTMGTSVGLSGFLNTTYGGGTFPINLVALTPFFFYFAVGYSIARYDLFDIDAALKRTVAYGAVTCGVIAAYVGAVTMTDALGASVIHGGRLLSLTFVILIAVLFEPARARVQRAVDHRFSRDRIDHRRVVGELSVQLARLLDVDLIVDRVIHTVHEQLGLQSSAILLWHPGTRRALRYDPGYRAIRPLPDPGFPAVERLLSRRDGPAVWMPGRDGELDGQALGEARTLDASVVVALRVGEQVLGAVALGRRRSGRVLVRSEIELLQTLAAHTATALGNAISYHALEAANLDLERRVAARTAELSASHGELTRAYEELRAMQSQLVHNEKMASLGVLVAGVAHEINNPVTFIVGGLEPLEMAIQELRRGTPSGTAPDLARVLDRMARAVGAIGRGAERTAGIVRDLRTFSHLGDAPSTIVDLRNDIEVTLRLLHPRWADRITIHRAYADLPPFEGASNELNQVWMNLLANACDAIAERGNVWITTASDGEAIRVTVCDDGAGIDPAILSRIFDPFFTTRPPGDGTGFGLAVSHGIVTRHGGRIEVESTPTRGSTFVVHLPIRTTPPPAATTAAT